MFSTRTAFVVWVCANSTKAGGELGDDLEDGISCWRVKLGWWWLERKQDGITGERIKSFGICRTNDAAISARRVQLVVWLINASSPQMKRKRVVQILRHAKYLETQAVRLHSAEWKRAGRM